MRRIVQSVGAVFAVIAFTLLLVALLTNGWVEVDVDRSSPAPSVGLAGYSRNKGLYQECWTAEGLSTVIKANNFSLGDMCLYIDLGVIHRRPDVTLSSDYKTRTALLTAMWIVMGLAVLFIFIAVVLYLYTLCQHVNNYQWKHGTKAAAGLMLAAVILNVAGMGLYHGAQHLEMNEITDPDGTQAAYKLYFPLDLSADLSARTRRTYSWSYALSWCALACELLSSVLFMTISCCYVKSKKSVYTKPVPKKTTVVVGTRNPAYDVVHERVVVASPQVYVVNDNDYYDTRSSRQGSYNYGHSMGQAYNGYSPNYGYNDTWMRQ